MITEIYTIYDAKAKIFNKPFHQHNEEVALRTARTLLDDHSSDIAKHPSDFILYRLGTYDDDTGSFSLNDQPEVITAFNALTPESMTELSVAQ